MYARFGIAQNCSTAEPTGGSHSYPKRVSLKTMTPSSKIYMVVAGGTSKKRRKTFERL
jgi:hypothetical protein